MEAWYSKRDEAGLNLSAKDPIRSLFRSRIMTQLCGTQCTYFTYNFMYTHNIMPK